MLSQERKTEIEKLAGSVNSGSEKFQLIHATFAIQKLFKDKIKSDCSSQIADIRSKILNCTDADELKLLRSQAENVRKESDRSIHFMVYYIPQLIGNNARTTRTKNNTFMIALPQSLENLRDENGVIDFDKMKRLRFLMAHELAHIVLHYDLFSERTETHFSEAEEEEADYFAKLLIKMRKERNEQIYDKRHFEDI